MALGLLVALRVPETLPGPHRHGGSGFGGLLRSAMLLGRDRAFIGYLLTGGCVYSGLFAFIAGPPYVFIDHLGVSPERFDYLFTTLSLTCFVFSTLSGRLPGRLGSRDLIAIGAGLAVAGGLAMSLLATAGVHSVAAVLVPQPFCMMGMALTLAQCYAAAAPHSRPRRHRLGDPRFLPDDDGLGRGHGRRLRLQRQRPADGGRGRYHDAGQRPQLPAAGPGGGRPRKPEPARDAMRLYGYYRSSAAYRVRIALPMKGLDYEQVPVYLRHREQHGEAHRAVNPQGLVPTLEVGAARLGQSLAIIEYLDEMHPGPGCGRWRCSSPAPSTR